jgi:hypothetical protein
MAKSGDRLVAETPEAGLGTATRVRPDEHTEKPEELSLSEAVVPGRETKE